jgi:pimeloyl-ACP methyl ester carboxylesterase
MTSIGMRYTDAISAERRAAELVDAFVAGDFETLRAAGDTAFAAAAKGEEFSALHSALGPLRARGEMISKAHGDIILVELRADFTSGPVTLRLALRGPTLTGFFIAPSEPPAPPWIAPSYVDARKFEEREVAVQSLPATLTLPNGVTLPPVCLFVHGSGPQDRDETLGPNKPFRDLAQGLATLGVASLRYDKRTRVLPEEFTTLSAPTVWDEVLYDVVAALRQLAKQEEVDGRRIVIVGHSLGAMLAPRIAAENKEVKGLAMIGAAARPLVDVTLAQFEYLESLSPSGRLHGVCADVARVRAARPGDVGPPFLGTPLSWWTDLSQYDPVVVAGRLKTPMLFVHGGRDYQVTDSDFDLFQTGLADRENIRFLRFADLNHMMIAGRGPSVPAEYRQPGHVDAAVVNAIADFVFSL